MNNHTFAICAYKESPYLEECIQSTLCQTVASEVILVTSTPCEHILKLCSKYHIPVYINDGEKGITQDWNFAYAKSKTPIVTIAHQDDIYFEKYTETLEKMSRTAKRPLIFFCDYYELRNKKIIKENSLLKIKRIMLFPLHFKILRGRILVRRMVLSTGNPICCPSVAYFRGNLPNVIFKNHFRSNEDWEAFEMISKIKGQFLYCKEPLMAHRIHEDSATTAIIADNDRTKEDYEMFCKFWPKWLAKIIEHFYKQGEKSNEI